jgi:threonine synthase
MLGCLQMTQIHLALSHYRKTLGILDKSHHMKGFFRGLLVPVALQTTTALSRPSVLLGPAVIPTTTRLFASTKDTTDSMQSHLVSVADRRRWEVHDSILDVIGQTPIVKLQKLSPKPGVDIYVKCENGNPGGSVKDRLAMGVIEWAEKHGQIKPGQTVVEASSGNTGIGLAMVCAVKGYPLVCVMAESFSIERRKLMRFLGAKVVLTNPAHKATGMLIKAKELADKHGFL